MFCLQLKQSATSGQVSLTDLAKLKSQISHLEEELSSLRALGHEHVTLKEKTKDKDSEISRLRHELKLAQKDIEIYHKWV